MKNFCLTVAITTLACSLSFAQEESQAIKKMNASADLTVEWLKKNIKISDAQAAEFLKVLNIPGETIKNLGSLSKNNPDSLAVAQGNLSADIKRDFEKIFTPQQWETYNSRKDEFAKWLEKKLKNLGY